MSLVCGSGTDLLDGAIQLCYASMFSYVIMNHAMAICSVMLCILFSTSGGD